MRALNAFTALGRDNRLLALSMLLWGAGEGLFIYIQPLYLQQLGADPDRIGSILGITQFVLGMTFIPAGWLADRLGYRPLLITGWMTGLVAAVVMAAAPNLDVFTVGLLCYSLSGFVVPVMSGYITAARERLRVEQALATVYAAYALGSVPSPAAGGWIGGTWGLPVIYRAALVFMGASTIVVFLLSNRRIEPHAPEHAGPPARPLWRQREFVILSALLFAVMTAMFLPLPLTPNFLQNERGVGVDSIGVLGTLAAVGGIVLQLWLGRQRPRRTLVVAQGLMLAAVLLLWHGRWLPLFGLAYFLRPSLGLARLGASALAARIAGHAGLGAAYGVIETISALAIMAATFAAGALYTLQPDAPYIAAAALLPALMIVSALATPRPPALPPIPETRA